MPDLTPAQTDAIRRLVAELGATAVSVERDEPHDEHVFATFHQPGAARATELIIDADGSHGA